MNTKLLATVMAVLLAAPALAAEVKIGDPWVRATAPGQKVAGAFMDLTADADMTLVAAESPTSKTVELHTMRMEEGVMVMRRVTDIALPRGRTVQLEPGGLHVMLIDIKAQLKAGDAAPLTLVVRDAGGKEHRIAVEAQVRAPGGMEQRHHHH